MSGKLKIFKILIRNCWISEYPVFETKVNKIICLNLHDEGNLIDQTLSQANINVVGFKRISLKVMRKMFQGRISGFITLPNINTSFFGFSYY
jgi:hypothetical protein